MQTNPPYIDVILPHALANTYTYRIPAELETEIRTGMRVIVPFGNKKIYTASVVVCR